MTLRETISDRDTSKRLIVKSKGKVLFNSQYHSYDKLERLLECIVIESHIGETVLGVNIKQEIMEGF